MKNRPGPTVRLEKLTVLGKYLNEAMTLANMSQSELARRAGLRSSTYLSRAMKGRQTVSRETLLAWCAILDSPGWLTERLLNAAGYASDRQQQIVAEPEVLEETHKLVMDEVSKRES